MDERTVRSTNGQSSNNPNEQTNNPNERMGNNTTEQKGNDVDLYMTELQKISHRPYTTGFVFGGKETEFTQSAGQVQTHEIIAVVIDINENRTGQNGRTEDTKQKGICAAGGNVTARNETADTDGEESGKISYNEIEKNGRMNSITVEQSRPQYTDETGIDGAGGGETESIRQKGIGGIGDSKTEKSKVPDKKNTGDNTHNSKMVIGGEDSDDIRKGSKPQKIKETDTNFITVQQKNKFGVGDIAEILSPSTTAGGSATAAFNKSFIIEKIISADDKNDTITATTPNGYYIIKCPFELEAGDILRKKLTNIL
jgi:hypothetical protein